MITEGKFYSIMYFCIHLYYVTVGTMNFFMLWINESGEKELVTPPLDGTILPGVTRDSILALTKEWKEFKVSEKLIKMGDVTKAIEQGRVLEMFGAGIYNRVF